MAVLSRTLADHRDVSLIERDVCCRETSKLTAPAAGIEEHADDRAVASVNEVLAVTGCEQCP